MEETEIRLQIVEAGRRLYQKGMVASNDGNISARVSEDRIVITPTGVSKGDLSPEDLITVNMEGRVVSGRLNPTSEIKMHLVVYEKRPDVRAIVHAHPPNTTAYAVCRRIPDKIILPEVVFSLGKIALAPYATPSTQEVPDAVSEAILSANAVILSNHGALTVGRDVMHAYFNMETLEHFSAISILSELLGGAVELTEIEKDALFEVRRNVFGKTGLL